MSREELSDNASCSASTSSFLADTTCGPSSLQLPSPAPCRRHALAPPCALCGPVQHHPPCPAHYPDVDVRTKLIWRHLHANPLLLSTSMHACARMCALTLFEHGRALTATPSSLVGPGARSYKRGPSRSFCPRPHRCLPLVSCHRRTASSLHRSISAKPSHPTSLPVCRSRSSAGPHSCSHTSSSHFFFVGEPKHQSRAGELPLPRRPPS
jgi:hypothetical protein